MGWGSTVDGVVVGAGIASGLALEGFFGRNARLFIVCGVLSSDEDAQGFGRSGKSSNF